MDDEVYLWIEDEKADRIKKDADKTKEEKKVRTDK